MTGCLGVILFPSCNSIIWKCKLIVYRINRSHRLFCLYSIGFVFFFFNDLKYLQEEEYTFLFPLGSTIPYCFILCWNFEFAPSIIKDEILIKSKKQTKLSSPVIIWNEYLFCPKGIDYKKIERILFRHISYTLHCSSSVLGTDDSSVGWERGY